MIRCSEYVWFLELHVTDRDMKAREVFALFFRQSHAKMLMLNAGAPSVLDLSSQSVDVSASQGAISASKLSS